MMVPGFEFMPKGQFCRGKPVLCDWFNSQMMRKGNMANPELMRFQQWL